MTVEKNRLVERRFRIGVEFFCYKHVPDVLLRKALRSRVQRIVGDDLANLVVSYIAEEV